LALPIPPGQWQRVIDAATEQYGGAGTSALPPVLHGGAQAAVVLGEFAFALYRHEPWGRYPEGRHPERE
jgi:hypothetical protein